MIGQGYTIGTGIYGAVGINGAPTASNQAVIGGIREIYLGTGVTSTSPYANVTINAGGAGSALNQIGSHLSLAGGRGT
jgi:hypothetical protein